MSSTLSLYQTEVKEYNRKLYMAEFLLEKGAGMTVESAMLLEEARLVARWQKEGREKAQQEMALVNSGDPKAIEEWNHNTGQTGKAVTSKENKSKRMFASIKQAFKSAKHTIKTYTTNAAKQMVQGFFKGP